MKRSPISHDHALHRGLIARAVQSGALLVSLGCSRWTPISFLDDNDVHFTWDVRVDTAPPDGATAADGAVDVPSPRDGCAPSTLNFCGADGFPCTCGTCVPWGRDGRDLCITSPGRSCPLRLAAAGACAVREVCLAANGSTSGLCVPAMACLMFTDSNPDTRCWYTDDTIARVGALPPARCESTGFRACGAGCPTCPDGRVCAWASERAPTGVCVPLLRRDRIVTCTAVESPLLCQPGEMCLLPTRDPAAGIPDASRIGACVPRDECLAVRTAFPSLYLCRSATGP